MYKCSKININECFDNITTNITNILPSDIKVNTISFSQISLPIALNENQNVLILKFSDFVKSNSTNFTAKINLSSPISTNINYINDIKNIITKKNELKSTDDEVTKTSMVYSELNEIDSSYDITTDVLYLHHINMTDLKLNLTNSAYIVLANCNIQNIMIEYIFGEALELNNITADTKAITTLQSNITNKVVNSSDNVTTEPITQNNVSNALAVNKTNNTNYSLFIILIIAIIITIIGFFLINKYMIKKQYESF
jgi:hypothetical protein